MLKYQPLTLVVLLLFTMATAVSNFAQIGAAMDPTRVDDKQMETLAAVGVQVCASECVRACVCMCVCILAGWGIERR